MDDYRDFMEAHLASVYRWCRARTLETQRSTPTLSDEQVALVALVALRILLDLYRIESRAPLATEATL